MTTYFVSNAGSNTAPYDTEAKAANSLGTIATLPWLATDVVKVSSTHTETAGAAITYTFPATPGLQILSVLFNGSGTGGLASGASINVGAANGAFTLGAGFPYGYGITFTGGTNDNALCDVIIGFAASPNGHKWENCVFSLPSINAGALFSIGAVANTGNDDAEFNLVNCTLTGGNKTLTFRGGIVDISNLTLAGTAPTTLFSFANGSPCILRISASDLSGVAWTNFMSVTAAIYGSVRLAQCKLPSGFVVTTGTFPGPGQFDIVMIDCASGDTHYTYQKHCWQGTIVASNSIYADASDGTNSISWLMTGNANTSFAYPLVSPPIDFFNDTLSAMTTTVEVTNDGTTFTDAQLWQETQAKVTSGSTKSTVNIADRAADILAAGAAQANSTKSWTGTSGFSAEVKQQLVSGSFTPAEVGPVRVVVKLAANNDVYVSPKVLSNSRRQWMSLEGVYINTGPTQYAFAA